MKIRRVGAGAALLAGWWIAGCGARWPHGPGGAGGSGGCLGACSDASSADAAVTVDAATDTGTDSPDSAAADSGSSRPSPGGCFAPCEWEAIKDCLPAKAPSCVHIGASPAPYTGSDTFCAAGWSTSIAYEFHKTTLTVTNDGKVCYSRVTEFGSNGPLLATVYDGSGNVIAREWQDSVGAASRSVYCGDGADAGPVYDSLEPVGCDSPSSFTCESVVEDTTCP